MSKSADTAEDLKRRVADRKRRKDERERLREQQKAKNDAEKDTKETLETFFGLKSGAGKFVRVVGRKVYSSKIVQEFQAFLAVADKDAVQTYDKSDKGPILAKILKNPDISLEQMKTLLPALKEAGVNFTMRGKHKSLEDAFATRPAEQKIPLLEEIINVDENPLQENIWQAELNKQNMAVVAKLERERFEAERKERAAAEKAVMTEAEQLSTFVNKGKSKLKDTLNTFNDNIKAETFVELVGKATNAAIKKEDTANEPLLTNLLGRDDITANQVTGLLPKLSKAGVNFTPKGTPPLVQVAEAWKSNPEEKGLYLDLATALVVNGAHADAKMENGENIFKIIPEKDKAELRAALIEAQAKIGKTIRKNRTMESALEDAKNVAKRMANFLSENTVKKKAFEVKDTERDVLRNQQKAAGRAIRGGR